MDMSWCTVPVATTREARGVEAYVPKPIICGAKRDMHQDRRAPGRSVYCHHAPGLNSHRRVVPIVAVRRRSNDVRPSRAVGTRTSEWRWREKSYNHVM